jgi:alcohol dehydrogenase, propanol-preferring
MGAVWAGTEGEAPPVPLDAAITFAPSASVVTDALGALARGATVVVNAIHLDGPIEVDYGRLWWERGVRSVANVTRADVHGLLDVVAEAGIRTTTEVLGLADANIALARLEAGDVRGSFVLVP